MWSPGSWWMIWGLSNFYRSRKTVTLVKISIVQEEGKRRRSRCGRWVLQMVLGNLLLQHLLQDKIGSSPKVPLEEETPSKSPRPTLPPLPANSTLKLIKKFKSRKPSLWKIRLRSKTPELQAWAQPLDKPKDSTKQKTYIPISSTKSLNKEEKIWWK